MAMRVVVGDLSESEVPAYEDTFDRSEGSPPLHFSARDRRTARHHDLSRVPSREPI